MTATARGGEVVTVLTVAHDEEEVKADKELIFIPEYGPGG
jgi:hypothetical protein